MLTHQQIRNTTTFDIFLLSQRCMHVLWWYGSIKQGGRCFRADGVARVVSTSVRTFCGSSRTAPMPFDPRMRFLCFVYWCVIENSVPSSHRRGCIDGHSDQQYCGSGVPRGRLPHLGVR